MAYVSEAKWSWYSSSWWYRNSDVDKWSLYVPIKAWDAGSGGTVGGEIPPSKGGKGGKGDKNVGTTEEAAGGMAKDSEHERSELKGEVRELQEEIRVLKKEAREMKEEVRVLSDVFKQGSASQSLDAGQGSGQRSIPDAGQGSGQICGWHGEGSLFGGRASVCYADTHADIENAWQSLGDTIGYELVHVGGQHVVEHLLWPLVEDHMANLQINWCPTKANRYMLVQCRHCKQGVGARLDKGVSDSDKCAFLLKVGAFFKIEEAVNTAMAKEESSGASAAELPKV
jgi:hypothetical protein